MWDAVGCKLNVRRAVEAGCDEVAQSVVLLVQRKHGGIGYA